MAKTGMRFFQALCVVAFFCGFVAVGAAFQVPDTGQEKCYDAGGELVGCPQPGDPYYGQDAQYQGDRSYTKLNGNGDDLPVDATAWVMVRDNVTGLIWEAKTNDGTVHDRDNTYTWCDTNPETNGGHQGTCGSTDTEDFISALNAENFGGYSDWRLPTIKELTTLVDSGMSGAPFIDTLFFPQTRSSYYCSSSTCMNLTIAAWNVYFNYGYVEYNYKNNGRYVRAVRGGQ